MNGVIGIGRRPVADSAAEVDEHGCLLDVIITGRMPRSSKLPVLNLLRPKIRFFSPRRADSLNRFRSNLAGLTGTWVRLAVQNFTLIGAGGGNAAPKYQKFPLFGKESPHRGEPLDQFLNFLEDFIRLTILH